MRRFGAWVAILLLCLYLVFLGGGWLGLYTASIRLTSVVLASIAIAAWLLAARTRPEWRPRSVLAPAIAAALVSLALSTAVSRHQRQSIEYLGYAILLAALYLLLVRLFANPFFRARLATFIPALALVMGVAFLVLNIGHWITWWGLVGHLALPPLRPESESLTYGNPSAAMTIVVLLVSSAVAVVGVSTRVRRAVVAVLVGLALFAIVVSGSRSGWFAIGVAVVVVAVTVIASADRRGQVRSQLTNLTSTGRGRAIAGVALVVVAGAVAVLAPTVIRRLTDSGADLRLNYILAAGRMFAEAPILGVGPGSWVIEHIRYTLPSETLDFIPHAHNIYAQTPAELGIVGVLAGLVLLWSLALLVRDGLRDDDAARRRWAWVALFALVYFGAHQVLDFYANMPAILFAAAIPVAWLDATASRSPIRLDRITARLPLRAAGAAGAAIVLAVTAAGLVLTELPALDETTAVDLANKGSWARADERASAAVASDPGWAPYVFTMGLTAANVGDHVRAAAAFRAVAESDDVPEAWLDLAAEELQLGDDAAAREALEHAARLGFQRPAIAIAIGELGERLDDWDLATRGYVEVLRSIPSLAADSWWQATPERAEHFPALVEQAIAAASPDAKWEIALMTGDPARALELAPSPATQGLDAADVIAGWDGDEAAIDRVIAAAQAKPLDGAAVSWAARLEGRRGDVDQQNRYLRWGFSINSIAGREVRVSDHQLLGRTATGTVAEFWGTYTYRRSTPWNPLVPSVVQLELH